MKPPLRILLCLFLLVACTSCSAIIDSKLDDKKNEIALDVQPRDTNLQLGADLYLEISATNFGFVPPGNPDGKPEPAGYYKVFFGDRAVVDDGIETEKTISFSDIFEGWDGEPLGDHELRVELFYHDGSRVEGVDPAIVLLHVVDESPCAPQDGDACDLCAFYRSELCERDCITRTCEAGRDGPCIAIAHLDPVKIFPGTDLSIGLRVRGYTLVDQSDPSGPPTGRVRLSIDLPKDGIQIPLIGELYALEKTLHVPGNILEKIAAKYANIPDGSFQAIFFVELVDNRDNNTVATSCWPVILSFSNVSNVVEPKPVPVPVPVPSPGS